MQFFIDSLQLLTEMHVNLFCDMVVNPAFKVTLMGLLGKQDLTLRLKCHEILETVTNYHQQFCLSKTLIDLGALRNQQSADNQQLAKKKAGG